MEKTLKNILKDIAGTIRQLAMDAVQKAGSGHPGLPMGCAEIGAYLYGALLNHNPKNSKWINRDRFILSAGHGSMLLYSLLHLSGFGLSLEEIKRFRQLYSQTPGHPERNETDGVEITAGPLGQGVGNSVGIALGLKIAAQKFNRKSFEIFSGKVYCLASDGDIMEGVAHEACSIAGHLGLDNLILIYDANNITLDGPLADSSSEDVKGRFRSYDFEVYEIDGHDFEALEKTFSYLRQNQRKPALIMAHTIIGKGAPNKANTSAAHGSPLGAEEVRAAKEALHLKEEEFYIPQNVLDFFSKRLNEQEKIEKQWQTLFLEWSEKFPELYQELTAMKDKVLPPNLEDILNKIEIKNPIAGRSASQCALNLIAEKLPFIYSGSADLSSSDMTNLKKFPVIHREDFTGRNIKYGVREFAMGTISNGLTLSGFITPVCGTFLTFSDYMRPSIRLASLSELKVIYQFTHDSIFLGEDGPTHQPVEQLASLRAIPGLQVIRPADSNEVKMAWIAALNYEGPTALILSRQPLPLLEGTATSYERGLGKGAYIVKKEKRKADYTFLSSGSELYLALEVAHELEKKNKSTRVISFPSWELFERQSEEYKTNLLSNCGQKISIEAAASFGWHKYIGENGIAISVESFGFSAPINDLAELFGFTKNAILQKLKMED